MKSFFSTLTLTGVVLFGSEAMAHHGGESHMLFGAHWIAAGVVMLSVFAVAAYLLKTSR